MAAGASPEALLGSRFADTYAAFAPLAELYLSFGDHLMAGTPIALPGGVGTSCSAYGSELELLQEEIVVAPFDASEALGAVVRLRVAVEAFRSDFGRELAYLGALPLDLEMLPEADESRLDAERFFARIHDLDVGFREALDAALANAEGEARWAMAMSFSMRRLLIVPGEMLVPERVLTAPLFYGSEDGTTPRFLVPEPIEQAMAGLTARAGQELAEDEAAAVRSFAQQIYEYFLGS